MDLISATKRSSERTTNGDTWLSPSEAANMIGVAPSTLAAWRSTRRKSLRFTRVTPQLVRYALKDVRTFLRSRTVCPGDDQQLATTASHHFSRFLDENIARIRRVLETQSEYAAMTKSELKGIIREQARDAVGLVFRSCANMDRLERGVSAVRSIAGGELPKELSTLWLQLEEWRGRILAIRKRFYPPVCFVDQQIRTDLSVTIGPLCDELKRLVIKFHSVAKSLYDLPELNGEGMN